MLSFCLEEHPINQKKTYTLAPPLPMLARSHIHSLNAFRKQTPSKQSKSDMHSSPFSMEWKVNPSLVMITMEKRNETGQKKYGMEAREGSER
jgi:hypothetical protein